ncbi:MAG: hypothetical protein AAF517_15350, partial [Planctomycetota bacterium]
VLDPVVDVRSVRVAGPKGARALVKSWRNAPKNLTVSTVSKDKTRSVVWRGGQAFSELVRVASDKDGEFLRLQKPNDVRCFVRLEGISLTFDAAKEYTRVLVRHNGRIRSPSPGFGARGGHESGFQLNDRMNYMTHDSRGGILERDSLRAETHGKDSFGQFRYRNYFGPQSRWTRQSVLTQEGYLVVRDTYEADANLAGYVAGPCWLLSPDADWKKDDREDRGPVDHDPKLNVFDAPAWDHAWWQTKKKRVLLWMHPRDDVTFGVTAHMTTPDISRPRGVEYFPTQNCHAKTVVIPGKSHVFLSVLVPFEEAERASKIKEKIQTSVDTQGTCKAHVGSVSVSIAADGSWNVTR